MIRYPPYGNSFLMEAAENSDPDRKLVFGLYIRLVINNSLHEYRSKFYRNPKQINLSYDEFDALVYSTKWAFKNVKTKNIELYNVDVPLLKIDFSIDDIPVRISKSNSLLE